MHATTPVLGTSLALVSASRDQELRRIEVGHDEPADEMLFDRASFKDALRQVSEVRLKRTLYAEYPELREYGAERKTRETHVIWLRVGGHEIFSRPQ